MDRHTTTNPRGTETFTDKFDVAPSYSSFNPDNIFLYFYQGEMRVYTLTKDEATELKNALIKVLK